MSYLVEIIFVFIIGLYGIAFFFNLPFRVGISKLACLFFFAFFFLMSYFWPPPEKLMQSDWCMQTWGGIFLLDPVSNAVIFQSLICGIGFIIFGISRSVRKFADRPGALDRCPPEATVPQPKAVDAKAPLTRPYLKEKYKDIEVFYTWDLNGGGLLFAPEFVRLVSRSPGKVGHVFEYCAGPGFIGFSLLAHNLCERLTLADINPAAVEAARETIRKNNLQERVTVYQSDCLDSIPESEQWDLVVSNPPWRLAGQVTGNLRVCDPEGRVHEKFYRDIRKFLQPEGTILFVEGAEYTDSHCFEGMLENNGLKSVEVFRAVSFWELFRDLNDYSGLNRSRAIFLRLGLFIKEAYFLRSVRKA